MIWPRADAGHAQAGGDHPGGDHVHGHADHRARAGEVEAGAQYLTAGAQGGQAEAARDLQHRARVVDHRVAHRGQVLDGGPAEVQGEVAGVGEEVAHLVQPAGLLGSLVAGLGDRARRGVARALELLPRGLEGLVRGRPGALAGIGEGQFVPGVALRVLVLGPGVARGALALVPMPDRVGGPFLGPGQRPPVVGQRRGGVVEAVAGHQPLLGLAVEGVPERVAGLAGPALDGVDALEALAGRVQDVAVALEPGDGRGDRFGVPRDEFPGVAGLPEVLGHYFTPGSSPPGRVTVPPG